MNEDSNSMKGSRQVEKMNHILDNMDSKDNEDIEYNADKTLQKLGAYEQKERKKKRLDITEADMEQ